MRTGGKQGKAPEELPLLQLGFALNKTLDEMESCGERNMNLMLMYQEALNINANIAAMARGRR